jgi:hypothetical protein
MSGAGERLTVPGMPPGDLEVLAQDDDLITRLELCMSEWTSIMHTALRAEHIDGKGT